MISECLLFILILLFYWKLKTKWILRQRFPSGPAGLPILGYLPFLGSVPCKTISKLAKRWGPIFSLKLGQYNVVFINDFETIKELYRLDSTTGRAQLALFEKRGKYGLGLLEGEQWKEVRRCLLKCLRDFGFGKRSMEGSIQEEVQNVIDFIKNKSDKPLYLKPVIELAVINALWLLMTSEKYDIEDTMKRKVAEVMSEGISDQNIVGIAAFLPWMAKLFPSLSGYKKGLEYFGAPEDMANEVIKKHIETYSPGTERDFIDHALTTIFNTTDPHSMFYKDVGRKNLHYTLIDMFFAGSDTMSSTLGWAFLYLAMWPDKQKRVHQEIDEIVGRSRLPSLRDRPRMSYSEATMYEVMRKSAILPFGLLHRALEDIEFHNYVLPKGTILISNLYHILHDPTYWGDPEEFRPERFITSDGMFRKDERMIPFFTGKRSCIGESLAMVEYFLFFSGIMQNFEFSLNLDEPIPNIGARSGFILPPPKHTLVINERINLLTD